MDMEQQAAHEEAENNIQEILREIKEIENRLDEGMLDERSYNNSMLHMKKLLSAAQRALDALDE
ncbi:MAG: hypothetical protein U9R03_01365 [Candidatus Aerophobetes bacterium]|nr:hypothetical protein [Candidatus Aerophobetes bacterium]